MAIQLVSWLLFSKKKKERAQLTRTTWLLARLQFRIDRLLYDTTRYDAIRSDTRWTSQPRVSSCSLFLCRHHQFFASPFFLFLSLSLSSSFVALAPVEYPPSSSFSADFDQSIAWRCLVNDALCETRFLIIEKKAKNWHLLPRHTNRLDTTSTQSSSFFVYLLALCCCCKPIISIDCEWARLPYSPLWTLLCCCCCCCSWWCRVQEMRSRDAQMRVFPIPEGCKVRRLSLAGRCHHHAVTRLSFL